MIHPSCNRPRRRRALLGFALSVLALATAAAQTVTVRVPKCAEPMYAFRFNGVKFVAEAPLAETAEGVYALPNDRARAGIAYVGPQSGGAPIPVVLDGAESYSITGNCANMKAAVIIGSPANDAYNALKAEFKDFNDATARLTQVLTTRKAGTPAYEQTKAELKALDDRKLRRLAELRAAGDDFLASVLAVNLYTSFANTEKGYTNELMYYINERFQYTDFSDPIYAGNPWVFESYRDFVNTLLGAGLPAEMIASSTEQQLDLVYNNRPVHKLALGGVIATLKAKQHPLAATFAEQYLKRYGDEEPEVVEGLRADIARLAAFEDGAVAPDFAQMTLDSAGTAGPSDFRGKVLLIDFWASWCGPCRKENPNVVAMYNAHRDAGFDILGVSLDKQHQRWANAVRQDGLAWTHVSDLRGWQNAAAQQYGVRSIPATVLLDREGRIVARNLRGAALEAKVAELLAAE